MNASRNLGFPLSQRTLMASWTAGWSAILLITIGDVWMQHVMAGVSFFESWYQVPRTAAPILIAAGLSVGVFLTFRRFVGLDRSFPSRLAHYVPIGLAFWIALSALDASLYVLVWPGPPDTPGAALGRSIPAWAFNSLLLFAVMAILYEAILNIERVSKEETRAARYEAELAKARTAALAAQLDPHFLFNTLHVVSGLMNSNVKAAREVLADLRALLRESFRLKSRDMVRLTDELRLVERYLRIQQARFGERLDVRFGVDPDSTSTLVPPLLLQPLVENAIQHGIARQTEGGQIRIQIETRSEEVLISVENSGAPEEPPNRPVIIERIGLGGVRARLTTFFGEVASVEVGYGDSGSFMATVTVPKLVGPPKASDRSDRPAQDDARFNSGSLSYLPAESQVAGNDDSLARVRSWGMGRWFLVGGLAWLWVAVHYHFVLGFRRMIQGLPFYSSWQQLAPNSLMFLVGAVLTPGIVLTLWKLRSSDRGRTFLAAAYIGIGLVFWVAWAFLATLLLPLLPGSPGFASFVEALVMSAFVVLALYTGIALIVEANWQLHVARRKAMQAAVLRADLLAEETAALRSKVDPRLLFDSLSVVSNVMGSDVRAARNVLSDLSELLRASLGRDGRTLVPLIEELNHLRQVLKIYFASGDGPPPIHIELEDDVSRRLIPRLVLQPLAAEIARSGTRECNRSMSVTIRGANAGGDRVRLTVHLECAGNGSGPAPVLMNPEVLDQMQTWLRTALGFHAKLVAGDSADGGYALEFGSISAVDA